MKKKIISNLLAGTVVYSYLLPAGAVEFNEQALSISGMTDVDLSAFEKSSHSEGKYFVGVLVNGHRINYFNEIDFLTKDNQIQACLPSTLIQKIGLKEQFIKDMRRWNDDKCLDLMAQDEHIQVKFDDEKQELLLSIPQAYFLHGDDNWVPPEQRQQGINAAILDYNIIDSYFNPKDGTDSHVFSSFGAVGANIGQWRLRSNFQYQKDFKQSNKDDFQWVQTYAFRDLPSVSSKLFIGEYYTSSNVFDSVRFKGVSAFSDENMMPVSLRGYAPNITGTATSNATVTISQNGRLLNQVRVSPGPFSIDNLSSSLSGTLDVRIIEEDGSVREYQVSTTSIPFLTRKGLVRYKFNAGQLSPLENEDVNSEFLSTEVSWGAFNNTSIYGGLFSTTDREYQAYNMGLGFNMEKFGALSFDVTKSINKIENAAKQDGYSYRLNYAKRFSDSSRINLTGYQFSNEGFMSANNYIDAKGGLLDASIREKNLFSMSFSQQIPAWKANVSLNVSKGTYWNSQNRNDNVSLVFNKNFSNSFLKNTLLTASLGESTYSSGDRVRQAFLSLSVPLDRPHSRIQYFGSYNDQSKAYNNNINYSDKIGNNNVNVGVSSTDLNDNTVVNGSLYRDTPYGTAQLSGAYNQDYQSVSAALDGSITATRHGPVLHRKVYPNQARMIIDTDKAANVSINEKESISNRFGLAGISNVPAYYRSTQYLDLSNMPENVSIEDNVIESALTGGAVGYSKITAIIGEKALTTISMPDGSTPPFGAFVYDAQNNKELGMVAEQGHTYLSGIQAGKKMSVKWGKDQSCSITINQVSAEALKNLTCHMD